MIIIWILIVIVLLVIFTVFKSKGARKEEENHFLDKTWGTLRDKRYKKEELDDISFYAKSLRKKGFYIDDITWNDLEMDKIFSSMDISCSSLGREYLYKTLRMPEVKDPDVKEKDSAAEWMSGNVSARRKLQLILLKLGFVRDFSFADHVNVIYEQKPKSSKVSILLDILLAASIVFACTVNALFGIIFVIAVILIATWIYFKKKSEIEPYFMALSQISRMVRCADELVSHREILYSAPESIKSRYADIENGAKELSLCKKGDFLIADSRSINSPLEVLMNYIRMFTHVDIIHYNHAVKTISGRKEEVMKLMEAFGFLELSITIASFRKAMKKWCIPYFSDNESEFFIEDIYHPMVKDPVVNSINVDRKKGGNILVTGSNASGKSTFLKAVAINAILSQSIGTSLSKQYISTPFKILSSMSLRDDLESSGSYYMVEIKSLKRIIDEAVSGDIPVLVFIDEVLRGTNTVERIAASCAVLEYLGSTDSVIFAATHDVELTYLLADPQTSRYPYVNYHFREEMNENGINFSYKLYKGRTTTRNAIALIENLGYDKKIVDEAKKKAENFLKTGTWK